nr:PREDICTED: CD83 antigen-like [Lepisosteus oculatus]
MRLHLTSYLTWVVYVCADHDGLSHLPCTAQVEPGVPYRKVSWYKVEEEGLVGLVLKNLETGRSYLYGSANHSYAIGEDLALLLPVSAAGDCGSYRCTLWPPLGHQIQDGLSTFHTVGCPKPRITPQKPDRISHSSGWDQRVLTMMVGVTGAVCLCVFVMMAVVAASLWRRTQGRAYNKLQVETLG